MGEGLGLVLKCTIRVNVISSATQDEEWVIKFDYLSQRQNGDMKEKGVLIQHFQLFFIFHISYIDTNF